MDNKELVLILDFGGQYNQLIARRVREAKVYCEVVPYDISVEQVKAKNPKGIIFTGGPASVYEEGAPKCEKELFELGVPVLGICYGAQLMSYMLGGKVDRAEKREYGKTEMSLKPSEIFKDVPEKSISWMSHTIYVSEVPTGFEILGTTDTCPVAAMGDQAKKLYGVQFHPEVEHTQHGKTI
ncbi:MAG: glutamine-hydrolyzing synthase, partial [Clostridia bacterium]|nr:glutamine-hydrolyzing synthase [Clostridia bacterium]